MLSSSTSGAAEGIASVCESSLKGSRWTDCSKSVKKMSEDGEGGGFSEITLRRPDPDRLVVPAAPPLFRAANSGLEFGPTTAEDARALEAMAKRIEDDTLRVTEIPELEQM